MEKEVRAAAPNLQGAEGGPYWLSLGFSTHLHQPWVLPGGQPIDVVGSRAEAQAQEARKGPGHTIASRNLLSPVTHIDPQGLEAERGSGR